MYDKVSKRNKDEDGKYAKWDTCDKCGKSFGAALDDCLWAFEHGDIICEDCIKAADPLDNGIENYEEIMKDINFFEGVN